MQSNIISAIHHLRIAKEHWQDLQREQPNTIGEKLGKRYEAKIDWIYKDFISCTMFTDAIREGCRKEWNSDVFAVPAIVDKISLLAPDKRELIESIIDAMLEGEEIIIKDEK